MKPYGRKKGDFGCCPGHDTFPSETYNNRRSKHAHTRHTGVMHRAERRRQRLKCAQELKLVDISDNLTNN